MLYDTGNPDTDVYYYLNKEGSFTGINPKSDYEINGEKATWIPFENYDAIYAKILMADFALVGGAVFHNNKMMSQKGSGSATYKDFKEDANGKPTGSFKPNLYINFITGYLEANDVNITGRISAGKGGSLGYFSIDDQGLYYGDISKWTTTNYKQNLAYITPGLIRLQRQRMYFEPGDIANIKVAIGDGADPALKDDKMCYSAAYFYRQMNPEIGDYYYPAVKIISDNVINQNVALYTQGAIVCHGGLAGLGHFNNANDVAVLDFSFGTTMVIYNTTRRYVYLPTLDIMREFLGTTSFCLHVRIVAEYDNTQNFILAFQSGQTSLYFLNYNGGRWT
ncbi:MAG: hypothetical protein LIP01_04910 [Tannerellaceae bacterium]|nr:hypothetical protein [Tannerellaceae bacterium]